MAESYLQGSFEDTLELAESICFDVKKTDFTLREIAGNLEGLEFLMGKLPGILENILPESNVTITLDSLYLKRLEEGSLIEDILSVLKILGDKNEVQKVKKTIMENKTLISILILGTASIFALKGCSEGKILSENQDSYIQLFAVNNITIPPQAAIAAIEKSAAKSTAQNIKHAVKFLSPAKKRQGSVYFGDKKLNLNIDNQVLKNIPDEYEPPAKKEFELEIDDTLIMFRAHDVDKLDHGWAGIIPAVHPSKRLKLIIAEDINRELLLNRSRIYADVVVISRANKESSTPIKAIVKKIYIPQKRR